MAGRPDKDETCNASNVGILAVDAVLVNVPVVHKASQAVFLCVARRSDAAWLLLRCIAPSHVCHVQATNVAIQVYHGTAVHLCNMGYSVDGSLVVTSAVNFSKRRPELRTVKFHTNEKDRSTNQFGPSLGGFFGLLATETQVKTQKNRSRKIASQEEFLHL